MMILQRQVAQYLFSESGLLWFVRSGVLCLLLFLSFLTIGCGQIPRDSEATERFKNDFPVVSELYDMLAKEPLRVVGITTKGVLLNEPYNQVDPEIAGLSRSEFSEYVMKMNEAKVIKILRRENTTYFYIEAVGFASEGWRLCYVYSQTSPSNVISSLDDSKSSLYYGIKALYRPVGDNWYIMLVRES